MHQGVPVRAVCFDEDGFLLDPHVWTPAIASEIAKQDGLPELTAEHWGIIGELRDHYLRYGALPVMSHVCRVNDLDRHCVTTLFQGAREAWRVAGLPNPGEEARTYM